ncbi:hypothetical protein [Loktanella sp. R86503]|uniref:hypothetical protein n=1 Tax=Loktanella sp. R86503 TaxID=3093847 RepID=UPI0036DB15F3
MTVRPHFPGHDVPQQTPRGGAPVGALHELAPIELAAVVYLRAWCTGGADRGMIARDFGLVMGDAAGPAVANFDALMSTLLENARRPVMRHGLGCSCIGGDENAFANLVAAAAGQDHDEALLFASALIKGHAAWGAVDLALRLGQVFLRLARMPNTAPVPTHAQHNSRYKN